MIYLNKLTISNVRRFAKDVEIDFADGATILLAPNGTGKTTIFEAIEMALTGKVNRLGEPPLAFIRENKTELDIRLDFTNGKYCEAKYRRGEHPILTGNHRELFTNPGDVPYLLRLTHLLEQRGKNWFVSSSEKDAANQLDKLSIGNDVNRIISQKQSLLRALTQKKDLLDAGFEKYKQELENLKELIANRDSNLSNSTLMSLSEIIEKINTIYSSTDKGRDFEVKDESDAIMGFAEQTQSAIESKQNDLNKYKFKLSEIEPKIELYIQIKQKNEIYNDNLNISIQQISELQKQIDAHNKQKDKENGILNFLQSENNEQKNLNQLFIVKAEKTAYSTKLQTEYEGKKTESDMLKVRLEILNSDIKGFNTLKDKHNLLGEEIDNKTLEINNNKSLKEVQIKWVEQSKIIHEIENIKLPDLYGKKKSAEETLNNLDRQINDLRIKSAEKSLNLKALQGASDAIHEAVSIIGNQINKDRKDCPVCGAIYDNPPFLVGRILNSLEKINPSIKSLIEEIQLINENIQEIAGKTKPINKYLSLLVEEINNNLNQKETSFKIITTEYQSLFPTCRNAEEVLIYIAEKEQKNNQEIENLKAAKLKLTECPTSETISSLVIEKQTSERQQKELEQKTREWEVDLITVKDEIEKISIKISTVSQNDILKNIEDKEIAIKKQIEKLSGIIKTIESFEDKLSQLKKEQRNLSEEISTYTGQQNKINELWKSLNLENAPQKEYIIERTKEINLKIDELANNLNELNILKEELAKWKGFEKYKELDASIKHICKESSELQYINYSSQKCEEAEQKVNLLAVRKATINSFFSNISIEQQNIHKYIESINEPWNVLLRKIVLNPLFAQHSLLSSSTYRNQALAKVESILHNSRIKVEDIASEAQLTDLQITFLLSMANRYKWTDWKTLLLDDPTQHHDLVHASSVFDILREYISELNFQVVLATHDTVQANLFTKKLINDGIPINLYSLISDKNGVMAERIN